MTARSESVSGGCPLCGVKGLIGRLVSAVVGVLRDFNEQAKTMEKVKDLAARNNTLARNKAFCRSCAPFM
jgi:hypothetical protein